MPELLPIASLLHTKASVVPRVQKMREAVKGTLNS